MAAFRTHVTVGLAVGYIVSAAAVITQWISLPLTPLLMFFASFIGSFSPDLDSDSGTSFDIVFTLFAFTGGGIAFYYGLQQTRLPWTYWLIIPPAVVVFIRYGVGNIFQKFTTHRGIFHSVPATLITMFSTPVLLQTFPLPVNDVAAIAFSVGAGFLSHLVLDEIYATVNFEGLKFKPKKSLGSALAFTKSSKTITIIAYVILVALIVYNLPLLSELLTFIRR
jgi:membrane-bound metal-dependent hydrolase YbcI (DUF457 family)